MPRPFKLDPLPMKEALAFWRDKVPMSRADFDELVEAMRAKAFYVSGLHRLDQVNAVKDALDAAIEKGETLAQFKSRIPEIIRQQNWSGVRLDIIFRTNVQAAYNAGRYAQMQKVKKTRPYWMYSAVNDARTRPAHRALHGKIFPADHPFWDIWMPPNGYRCRCRVVTLSQREIARDGLAVETEDPTGKLYEPTDFRTGRKMPARPLMPDPGFSGNVGKDWFSGLAPAELEGKIRDLKLAPICRDGGGVFADAGPCKPPLAAIDPRHILPVADTDILPRGMAPEDYAREFLREFGLEVGESKVHLLPGSVPVVISKGFFTDKLTGAWKTTWTDKAPYMRLLARTILNPYEMWMAPVELPSGIRQSLKLIRLFSWGKTIGGYCSFHLIDGRWWSATAFMPKAGRAARSQKAIFDYLEGIRQGTLVYREELK